MVRIRMWRGARSFRSLLRDDEPHSRSLGRERAAAGRLYSIRETIRMKVDMQYNNLE